MKRRLCGKTVIFPKEFTEKQLAMIGAQFLRDMESGWCTVNLELGEQQHDYVQEHIYPSAGIDYIYELILEVRLMSEAEKLARTLPLKGFRR